LLKKGDIEGAKALSSGAPATSTSNGSGGGKSAAQELSLIDFDAEPSGGASASQSASQGGNSLENDLLGLSLGETSSFGQGGGIALGFGANTNIPGPALLSSTTQNSTARGPSPQPGPSSFNNFNSFASPAASQSSTPKPPAYTTSAFAAPAAPSQAPNDPFAALAPLSSSSTPAPAAAPAPAAVSNDDDEWSFSSALPPEAAPAQPKEHRAVVSNTALKVDMVAVRSLANGPSPAISMQFAFSNNTAQPITEVHFQLAVTKGYELQLQPQTGRMLTPKQSRGITQSVNVWYTADKTKKVESVKLRWRVSYKVGAEAKAEMGEIPEFSVA